MAAATKRQTLDQLLEAARARITRYQAADALAAIESGALLIDIRSDLDRERDGIIPGSIHIPRTVLEWRLEPTSNWRNPHVGDLDADHPHLRLRLLLDPRRSDPGRPRLRPRRRRHRRLHRLVAGRPRHYALPAWSA